MRSPTVLQDFEVHVLQDDSNPDCADPESRGRWLQPSWECPRGRVDEHEGQPFISMQFLEGQTLKPRIARKPLGTEEVLELGVQLADALDAAHARGIVHRDMKPVFRKTGAKNRVQLTRLFMERPDESRGS